MLYRLSVRDVYSKEKNGYVLQLYDGWSIVNRNPMTRYWTKRSAQEALDRLDDTEGLAIEIEPWYRRWKK